VKNTKAIRSILAKTTRAAALIVAVGLSCFAGERVSAETLRDALVSAYRTNPNLMINRAALKDLDEGVAQARAGLRPTLRGTATGTFVTDNVDVLDATDTYGVSLIAEMTLWDGGRTRNAIEQAKALVASGRATLLDVEQGALLEAAVD
jgi:outer membrane protein